MPDETEVDGASFSLGRLHAVYQFNLTELVTADALSTRVQEKDILYPMIAPISGDQI